jgi:hypothetical protein
MGVVEGGILAYAAAAASVVGTAVSVYSQMEQADQADKIANQQANQAREDAQFALSEAQLQAKAIRKAAEKQRSEARGALASSGVVVGVGTAEQIDEEIQAGGEEDALMAIYDGTNRARAITQGGEINTSRSRNSASAARYGAASSALQGGSTLARGWTVSAAKASK